MFPGRMVVTNSSSAAVGRFTKKSRTGFKTTQGNFNFNGLYSGNDFADYLLGTLRITPRMPSKPQAAGTISSWALYFQDNWRVTSRLTLNLGSALGWHSAHL